MKKGIVVTLIIFGLIGLVDASYLTAQHYSGNEVVCSIGEHTLGNCDSVLTSEYSMIGPVPLGLVGAVYYFVVFALAASLLTNPSQKILQAIVGITAVGFLGSVWFVYLQLFVLNAICLYCMLSALSTTVLFVTSLAALRKEK